MFDTDFRRLRDLILDIYEVNDVNIEFDTSKATGKGYSDDEIAIADIILAKSTGLYRYSYDFRNDIQYLLDDENYDPIIIYIEVAKIIFIIDWQNELYTYIFEEELEQEVAKKKSATNYFEYFMDFILATKKNDAFGNPL